MVKKFLTRGEEIDIELKPNVYITNKRVIQYDKNSSSESFKDISLKFLESLSFESLKYPWLLVIGGLGFVLSLIYGTSEQAVGAGLLLGLIWLLIFIWIYYATKAKTIVFSGTNNKITCNDDISSFKDIRELFEKYN